VAALVPGKSKIFLRINLFILGYWKNLAYHLGPAAPLRTDYSTSREHLHIDSPDLVQPCISSRRVPRRSEKLQ